MNQFLEASKGDFNKVLEHFQKEIHVLRVGRANPEMLDNVMVDAYGAKSGINALGSISVSDTRSMTVQAWDKSVLKDIEKAIIEADLGLSVVNEGDKLRLTLPIMTEENRKNLVKKLNEMMEDARVGVRKVREEVKQSIEKAEKDKEISEDEKYSFVKELDEEVQKNNELIKTFRDKKEQEIMTI